MIKHDIFALDMTRLDLVKRYNKVLFGSNPVKVKTSLSAGLLHKSLNIARDEFDTGKCYHEEKTVINE
jgi:hypothetical protein